jgi:hypothetical protein
LIQILQICTPLPGSYAVYSDSDGSEIWVPLSCWALVEEDDGAGGVFRFVDGFDAINNADSLVISASETKNFLRFDVEANK